MVIDCHTHLGLHNKKDFTPEDILLSMKKAGIAYSFVIAERTRGDGLSTEGIIKIIKKYKRLKAIGNIEFDTLDQNQIKKMCDYLKNSQIIAVKLYLGYEEFYAGDARLFPLYQFCSKNGYPVMYHTGVPEANNYGALKYAHPLTIDEVANRFPALKIVIAHIGNPWIMDCAAVILKNKNVYSDLSGFFDEYKPIKNEQKNFFINKLWEFKQFIGGFSKCLFGTDWPLYDQKEYLDVILQLRITREEQEATLWKNAQKIFNLTP